MRLDLATRLTLPNLEHALGALKSFPAVFQPESGSSPSSVTVDLSRVEWVEPAALVMLTLLLEHLLRHGADITIWTPYPDHSRAELEYLARASASATGTGVDPSVYVNAQVARRGRATDFLDVWQFRKALEAPHILALPGSISHHGPYDNSITADRSGAPVSSPNPAVPPRPTAVSGVPTYKNMVPLTWIAGPQSDSGRAQILNIEGYDITGFIRDVLNVKERILSIIRGRLQRPGSRECGRRLAPGA